MCGMTLANRKAGSGVFVRVSRAAVLGMLVAAGLTWLPLPTFAGEPNPEQQEFVAFLEYLGSWDGNEEDWVQFLDAPDAARTEGASPAAADAKPGTAHDGVDDSDLQLATAGS